MAAFIKNRQLAADTWQRLSVAADKSLPAVPAEGDVIVPLAQWLAERDTLLTRSGRLGVWLASNEDPALLANDLSHFGVIAIEFRQFADGRGYSIARLLRERYGWQGELRAIGDIQRDHVYFMSRCGFDAFALREGENAQAFLTGFDDFSEAYQVSVERPQPLFRRRIASGTSRA